MDMENVNKLSDLVKNTENITTSEKLSQEEIAKLLEEKNSVGNKVVIGSIPVFRTSTTINVEDVSNGESND